MGQVTQGINPAYAAPDVAIQARFEGIKNAMGRGVWDKSGKNAWWGLWPECPEWVAIMKEMQQQPPIARPSDVFTSAEIAALKKRHGTADVEWQRAAAVKMQIEQGVTTVDSVAAALAPTWKRTQISIDLAALKAANE